MNARVLLWMALGVSVGNGCVGGAVAVAQRTVEVQGTVVDRTGAAISGATVRVVTGSSGSGAGTTTDSSGFFTLRGVAFGESVLTVVAPGFERFSRPLSIASSEVVEAGMVTLAIDSARVGVQVNATNEEIATEQVKEAETQRLFGVIPNFLVTYRVDAVPLTAKQKFGLMGRFTVDPSTFVIAAGIAGLEQAGNSFPGYGEGAQGYGKRFGAAYADFAISSVLGSGVLPVLFRQDPRYFVKGTGTVRARLLYAVANSVIRKGDNGRWQPDYSSVVGALGAAGISNLYYPTADRNGAAMTFEQAGIGVAASAAANVLQEFVLRHLTRRSPKQGAATP